MTQKHVQVSVTAVFLLCGVTTAWAEVKNESRREQLPAPRCCCERSGSLIWGGCAADASSPCCAQQRCDGPSTCAAQDGAEVINKLYPVGKLLYPADPVILQAGKQELFLGWAAQTPNGPRLLEDAPEAELIQLIRNTIQPTSWRDQGGAGTMDYLPTAQTLVVHQTAAVQEQIADLLAALGRLQEQACSAAPPLGLPLPPPAPAASPAPSFTLAPLLPQLLVPPLPPPFASSPLPPPSAPVPTARPAPAPSLAALPGTKMYVLEATVTESQPDGKGVHRTKRIMQFLSGLELQCDALTGQEAGNEQRKWSLLVKATPLKKERVRLEVVSVHGQASQADDGQLAVAMDARPLMDRKVKLGQRVKKVLETDANGKPSKWLELQVKEMPPAPLGAICPPPAGVLASPAAPTAMPPLAYFAAPIPYQPLCPAIAPALAVGHGLAGPLQNEQQPPWQPGTNSAEGKWVSIPRPGADDSTWKLRVIVEDGKPTLLVREGDRDSVTLKSLVVKVPGNDPLKLTPAGTQIRARNGCLHARADKVARTGQAGCFVFEGHVKLTYQNAGQLAKVTAERVLVNVADGRIEIQNSPGSSLAAPPER